MKPESVVLGRVVKKKRCVLQIECKQNTDRATTALPNTSKPGPSNRQATEAIEDAEMSAPQSSSAESHAPKISDPLDLDGENFGQQESEVVYNVKVQNRWGILNRDERLDDKCKNQRPSTVTKKPARVPPIILPKPIGDYGTFCQQVRNVIGGQDFTVRHNAKNTKIFVSSIAAAETLMQSLKKDEVEFYTHPTRDETVKRIVMKAAPNMDVNDIKEELMDQNYDIRDVKCLRGKQQNPYSYLITVAKSVNIGDLKRKVNRVGYTGVRWQTYSKRSGWSQCHRCQLFGHGSSHCNNNPRCVKCAGEHMTYQCSTKKGDGTKARCCNCNGEHPANYSECPELLNYLASRTESNQRGQPKPRLIPANAAIRKEGVSYAQASANCTTESKVKTSEASTSGEFLELTREYTKLNQLCNISKILKTVKLLNARLSQTKNEQEHFLIFTEVLSNLDG